MTVPAALLSLLLAAAATDAKTGLHTHAAWQHSATHAITSTRRPGSPRLRRALVMIDLDHFAYLNNRFGHLAADELLRHIAPALRDATGPEAIIGRFGGDEFAVLLPVTDLAGLHERAESLRRAVEGLRVTVTAPFGPSTVTGVTASIGAALHPDSPTSPATRSPEAGPVLTALLWTADRALYDAKYAGRNTTRVRAVANDARGQARLL